MNTWVEESRGFMASRFKGLEVLGGYLYVTQFAENVLRSGNGS